ncbi:transposase [Amycolatopsis azurea]|uniref:transposase n=1 Tax=Amycolatopsis azurea TaxID=36819 RepID=UPI0037F8B641
MQAAAGSAVTDEVQRLRKQVAELQKEKEILRKAAAYFVRDHTGTTGCSTTAPDLSRVVVLAAAQRGQHHIQVVGTWSCWSAPTAPPSPRC